MTKNNKVDRFLKLIGKHKEQKKAPKFQGSLSEYLKIIEEDPDICQLAHKRLYTTISTKGITRMKSSDERCNKLFGSEELRTYDYFQGKFFGMERSLAKIMRFLRSASLKGEESRQVLLLLGPRRASPLNPPIAPRRVSKYLWDEGRGRPVSRMPLQTQRRV